MYKTPCSRLSGLVGASVKQKLVQNVPRCSQTARSLLQLHRRDPSNWLTYQHLNFLKRQYVSKNNSELQQRAIPKQAPVLTIVDESDDSVERQVQRISAIDPLATQTVSEDDTSNTQPEISTLKPTREDAAAQSDSVSSTETPHVNVETDLAREARLEKQWKQLKVDMEELPDVYARLAKIKLTADGKRIKTPREDGRRKTGRKKRSEAFNAALKEREREGGPDSREQLKQTTSKDLLLSSGRHIPFPPRAYVGTSLRDMMERALHCA